MSEKLNNDVAVTEPVAQVKKRESVHLPVHLPWYKTQWGSGLILGIEVGMMAGIPIAFLVYKLAVVVVHLIEGV